MERLALVCWAPISKLNCNAFTAWHAEALLCKQMTRIFLNYIKLMYYCSEKKGLRTQRISRNTPLYPSYPCNQYPILSLGNYFCYGVDRKL